MRPTVSTRSIPGMWRWRRNPLRRRSDVVEAWAGLATVVMAGVGAPIAGYAAGQTVDSTLRQAVAAQRAERHQVTATVLRIARPRAPVIAPDNTSGGGTSRTATVSWQAKDGSRRQAQVSIVGRHALGSTLTVWADRRDRLVQPPLDPSTITTNAVAAGLGAASTLTGLLLLARRVLAWRILRQRMAAWERDWNRVSQDWGHAGAGG